MMIYLATSGEYDDYRVEAAFTRREDAEAFELGDDVEEMKLHDGPLEVRTWHQIRWYKRDPLRSGSSLRVPNPYPQDRERRIWDGNPARVEVTSFACGSQVEVAGWDEALVRAKLDELMATTLSP
jgi:hypothetical protein